MDCRVKPGNDNTADNSPNTSPQGGSSRRRNPSFGLAFARPVGFAGSTLHRIGEHVRNLLSPPRVICPSGVLSTGVSTPFCKNISLHPSGKSSLQIRAIPPHKRGVG